MPPPYFFYGTLTDDDVVRAILGRGLRALGAEPATLQGYRRVYAAGAIYPALIAAATETVDGMLAHRLTTTDIRRLDHFEGAGYGAHPLTVERLNGDSLTAMVYLPNARIRLSTRPWTLAHWQRLHKRKSRPDWDGPVRAHR